MKNGLRLSMNLIRLAACLFAVPHGAPHLVAQAARNHRTQDATEQWQEHDGSHHCRPQPGDERPVWIFKHVKTSRCWVGIRWITA
jgi:hypothetical protein